MTLLNTVEVPTVPRRDDPVLESGIRPSSRRYMEYLEQLTDAVQAVTANQIDLDARITALEP